MMRLWFLVLALVCLARIAVGAPAQLAPTGGDDTANFQATLQSQAPRGAVLLCGTYNVTSVRLVRNVAVQGCGPAGCILNVAANSFALWFVFNPGDQLSPGYFDISDCTINAMQPNSVPIFIWTNGDYRDVTQTIYGIRLRNLEIWQNGPITAQIGRSMGTDIQNVYIKGGQNGVYLFDCGEFFVSNVRGENSEGYVLMVDGTGQPDDHWQEGGHIDKLIANGTGSGLVVRNYGFLTATHLDLTTTKNAPALWLQGRVADMYVTAFDIGGNNGIGGLPPQPGILFDPSGDYRRITLAHGLVYGSSFGAQVTGTALKLDDVNFTNNMGTDLTFFNVHDSSYINGRADSASAPNVAERPDGTGNSFLNNVIAHGMSLTSGAIQRDNRAPTR